MIGNTKIIIVAGLKRSGSTWQFNTIKQILKGYKIAWSGSPNATVLKGAVKGEDYHIVKTHIYNDGLRKAANHVFGSFRDLEDAKASYERFGGSNFDQAVRHYRRWRKYMDYNQPYADLLKDKEKVVRKIAGVLGVDVDPKKVITALESIKPPKDGYDPDTFYFHNHITSK